MDEDFSDVVFTDECRWAVPVLTRECEDGRRPSRMSAACRQKAIGDFAVESVESHLKTSQGTSVHKVVVGRNMYAV